MASARAMKLAGQRVSAVIERAAAKTPATDVERRLEGLRQLREERSRQRRRDQRRVAVIGLLAACMGLAMFLLTRPRDLSFNIDGVEAEAGKWVAAPADDEVTLAFSDGSTLVLHPTGRARVAALRERGADVLLEDGTLSARVVHREETSWRISAGPFDVHVVGTAFDASWSSADETLTIVMSEGRVEVTGACLDAPKPVQLQESVRLSCRDVVRPTAAISQSAPGVASVGAALSGVPSVVPSVARTSVTPSGSLQLSSPSWRELSKKGEYESAFALAEREGAFTRAGSASIGELQELAELARLAGHGEVARRLYLTLREKAGGSDAAALAAFQLGRMGGGADAERWFRVYLAERPNGALAAEALGRILELENQSGRASARDTAQRYLNQFPRGAHAALARSILQP